MFLARVGVGSGGGGGAYVRSLTDRPSPSRSVRFGRMVYANPQEGARLRMEQQGLTFSGTVHGGHLYLLTAERAAGVELPMAALQRCVAEAD